jgi:hypothetical protein
MLELALSLCVVTPIEVRERIDHIQSYYECDCGSPDTDGNSLLVLPRLSSLQLWTAQATELLDQCKANKSSKYCSV